MITPYLPKSESVPKLTLTLPSERDGISAVTIDSKAYIFGRYKDSWSKDIYKFTPEWDLTDFDGYYIKTN